MGEDRNRVSSNARPWRCGNGPDAYCMAVGEPCADHPDEFTRPRPGSAQAEAERLERWLAAIREAAHGGDVSKNMMVMTAKALGGAEVSSRALRAYRARVPKIHDTSGTGSVEAGSTPDGSVGALCSSAAQPRCPECGDPMVCSLYGVTLNKVATPDAVEMVGALVDALIWCSGSYDFAPEGKAGGGWASFGLPRLNRGLEWLKANAPAPCAREDEPRPGGGSRATYPADEDPGTCLKCGAPFELVRPGKSQPTCRCWYETDEDLVSRVVAENRPVATTKRRLDKTSKGGTNMRATGEKPDPVEVQSREPEKGRAGERSDDDKGDPLSKRAPAAGLGREPKATDVAAAAMSARKASPAARGLNDQDADLHALGGVLATDSSGAEVAPKLWTDDHHDAQVWLAEHVGRDVAAGPAVDSLAALLADARREAVDACVEWVRAAEGDGVAEDLAKHMASQFTGAGGQEKKA